MNKAKDYIQLHLNILLFSLTSVFSKAASVQLNRRCFREHTRQRKQQDIQVQLNIIFCLIQKQVLLLTFLPRGK